MIDKESYPDRNVYSYTEALNNFRDNMRAKRLKKGLSQKNLHKLLVQVYQRLKIMKMVQQFQQGMLWLS